MTSCIALLAGATAVAAAVRSTWSPCGLSMLSTITPVSERSKGHSYRSTAAWFFVGATAGGATVGGAMALLALLVRGVGPSATQVGLIALVAALMAAWSDADVGGVHLPIHRRQVNERWLDHYRAWVYGAGFGWQIGTGLATYITTAAVYLMIVLAALTGSPIVAVAVGTGFGVLRGLAVLLTRTLVHPSDLLAFHRRLIEVGPKVARAVIGIELACAVVVAAWLRTPWAAVMAGGATLVAVLVPAYRHYRGLVAVGSCSVPTTGVDAHRAPGSGAPGAQGVARLGMDELVALGADRHAG